MATQTRFDLNAAIEGWRNELSSQRNLSPDACRELEAHLRDSIAVLQERGLREEEAFLIARKRIGELPLLNREFKRGEARHWERPLAFAAWIVFAVSFFLPALNQLVGWKTALLQSFFWPQALQGQWPSIHYLLLTFANVLMLTSPFLLARAGRKARFLKTFRWLSLGAAILVWSFIILLFATNNSADLKIGCYLWATSFDLLLLASLLQTATARAKMAQRLTN
jgi:hypothetical protein